MRTALGVAVCIFLGIAVGCDVGSSSPATPAPTSLAYSANPAVYTKGVAIPTNSPSSAAGGAVDTYSVSPSLPPGLSLNSSTGAISGTPTTVTALATYTVTASNSGGSTSVADASPHMRPKMSRKTRWARSISPNLAMRGSSRSSFILGRAA